MRFPAYCLLALAVFAASCRNGGWNPPKTEDGSQADKQKRVSDDTELTLPAGSDVVQFHESDRCIDPIWVAAVTVPASSYKQFEQAVLAKPQNNDGYTNPLADSTPWWTPVSVVLRWQYMLHGNTLVRIVVSEDGDVFTVYIECAVF